MATLRNFFLCDNFGLTFPRFCARNSPRFQASNPHFLEKVHQNATQIGNCVDGRRIDITRHNGRETFGDCFLALSGLIWLGIVAFLASLSFICLGDLLSFVGSLAANSQGSLTAFWRLLNSWSRPICRMPRNCARHEKAPSAQSPFSLASPSSLALLALLANRNHRHKSKCVNWFRLKYASWLNLASRCCASAA